jgi:hypothetical protein
MGTIMRIVNWHKWFQMSKVLVWCDLIEHFHCLCQDLHHSTNPPCQICKGLCRDFLRSQAARDHYNPNRLFWSCTSEHMYDRNQRTHKLLNYLKIVCIEDPSKDNLCGPSLCADSGRIIFH